MEKIGILGGTFNPIHNGHISIARKAYETYGLERVLFMPNGRIVYKNMPDISNEDRRTMVELAVKDFSEFLFSDFEMRQNCITYTSDTLARLKELNPKWHIHYIVGADSLCSMDSWHNPEEIFKNADIVAALRISNDFPKMSEAAQKLKERYGAGIFLMSNDISDVSSTLIRENVRRGLPIDKMVCPAVKKYIFDRGLYREF